MGKPRFRKETSPTSIAGGAASGWQRTLTKLAPLAASLVVGGVALHNASKSGVPGAVTTAQDALAKSVQVAAASNAETVGEAVAHVAMQVLAKPAVGVASDTKTQDASLQPTDTTQQYAKDAGADFSTRQNAQQIMLNADQKYSALTDELNFLKGHVMQMRGDLDQGRQDQQTLYNMTDQAFRETHNMLNSVAMGSEAQQRAARVQASQLLSQRQSYAHNAAMQSNGLSMVIGGAPAYMNASNNAPQTPADPSPEQYGVAVTPLSYQSNMPGGMDTQPEGWWGTRQAVVGRRVGGKLRAIAA